MVRPFTSVALLPPMVLALCAAAAQQPKDDASKAPDKAPEVKAETNQADANQADANQVGAKDEPGLVRVAKDYDIWIDPQRKRVIVGGRICLREGQLEMFACPQGTKEHEAIVSVHSTAQLVHAALLAVGAKPGEPVKYEPQYSPATGTTVDVDVIWRDARGKPRQARAQDWIRNARTGKALEYPWVFAGSGVWKDPQTGQSYYLADAGDLLCVSNFPSATLDLPVKSSQENSQLLYVAYTQRIPPLGAKVRLVLKPRLEPNQGGSKDRVKDGGNAPPDGP